MIYDLGNRQWHIPQLRDLLERVLPENAELTDYLVDHSFETLGRRVMLLSARRLAGSDLILLSVRDITERHQAEHALRESEERFRSLVTASSGMLYRLSPDWSEMRQLHGRGFLANTEQPSTGWLQAYIPSDTQPEITAAINEAIRTKSIFELEHRVRRLDGGIGWVLSRAVPILDERGEILEWFGSASDVTERRNADERLRESDRRKDEYLAMLGHELRNPLGAIRTATELLKQADREDERLGRAYGVLERQSSHMSRIIDGLLDVSRIARGKIHIERKPLDLRKVVDDVLEVRRGHIEKRELELETRIASQPVWVIGDEARLAQVLDNLLGNAIKFTHAPGTVTVEVEVDGQGEGEGDQASALVRVRDTGVGIRPELLTSIFEAFQQETQDVARTVGGLGLGLALAKGLVDLHDGSIAAHSDGPGQGAELVVRLPLSAPPADAAEGGNGKGSGRASRRIVIVEDNADAAQMLRDLLELCGHQVSVAGTGQAALDVLRQTGADVVLCDLGLPGMSGHDLARIIRSDLALSAIPLVALTGYGQPEDRKRTAEAGFNEHLVKPISLEALHSALGRLGCA
jgi:signal transduction histidine kinase/CheY-like chemotaxis protein